MADTKEARGYYIHEDLYALKEHIRFFDMILFSQIKLLDNHRGCFATNWRLAGLLDVSESSVSHGIARLKKIGLVEITGSNGKNRVVRASSTWHERARQLGTNVLSNLVQMCKQKRDTREELTQEKKAEEVFKQTPQRRKISFPGSSEKEEASDDAMKVIGEWNRLKCGVNHSMTSQAVEKALAILDTRLLKKHGVDKIIQTLHDYKTMIERPGYFNISKKRESVIDFLVVNDYVRRESMKKNGGNPSSIFERLIKSNGKVSFLKKSDEYPNLTKAIAETYAEYIQDDEPDFTLKQKLDFIEAARKLQKYFRKKKFERATGAEKDRGDHVVLLFNSLKWFWDKDEDSRGVSTGNLKSDYTYSDVIPKYLKEVVNASN